MSRQAIHTERAPAAIGPYSQAIVAQGWVFASGQIPLDPVSGEVVSGSIEAQADRALDNLGAVLEASGASWGSVVKATIFLTDLSTFARVNERYAARFEGCVPPARACVEVSALPKGVDIEIEAIALVTTKPA